jgi:parallel beta-helix repeat protein
MTARTFSFTVATPPPVSGNPLYVNNVTGNDSRTKTQARSASTPWATIGRATRGSTVWASPNAAEAASAGDTVMVAYTGNPYNEVGYRGGVPSLNKESVMLNCANNGTAANPITIQGVGGRPEVRAATAADRGGAIGSQNGSYIVWDGFTINDYYLGSGSDYGPVVLHVCNNITIKNCLIQGHTGSYFWGHATYGGNYRLIAIEDALSCTVRNNKIHRAYNGASPGGQNEAGLLSYSAESCLIENNTVWDCGTGIFIKGVKNYNQHGNVVRYNKVYDCQLGGIRILDSTGENLIYQNTINGSASEGAGLWLGFGMNSYARWFNNVIYDAYYGIQKHNDTQYDAWTDIRFNNNIVVNSVSAAYNDWTFTAPDADIYHDRNLYYGNQWVATGIVVKATLADWQAWSPAKCDPNGSAANPLFVNAAGGDFHLQSGSPARTLGRDYYALTTGGTSSTVIPVGAYVTGTEQIGADW